MPSVETIYEQTVLPLPPEERVKLARIIMEHADEDIPRLSAYDYIESLAGTRLFKDSASVDEYLRSERESWDN
jgi:hypothetical protein